MVGPRISLVVAARNDDYGGNFLHRMQVFVNSLLTLWKRHELNGELIIVEWNPPEGKPRLAEALSWPPAGPSGSVRIIEVSKDLHGRLPHADRIVMFEFVAKNVGIRRARGEFVLATNADIIFNDELIKFLATESLSPDCFYRIDRYDVALLVPLDLPVDEQLRFCAENAVRVRGALGTFPLKYMSSHNNWIYEGYLTKLSPRAALRWFKTKFVYRIHTGAPGDFTLMARRRWQELRGYPELSAHKSHLDCYLCFMAKSAGLSQMVLRSPQRIYHQEHSAPKPGQADYEAFWRDAMRMSSSGRPVILNDESWGLGDAEPRELVISPGALSATAPRT